MRVFKTRTRVRYAETDASGIVYYGSYLVYAEIGRIEMFRELGLPYSWRLPIVETHFAYHSPARFDEQLEVHSFVEDVRSKGFRIGFRIFRIDEAGDAKPRLLTEGYTAMVTVGEDRRPVAVPDEFRQAFDNAG